MDPDVSSPPVPEPPPAAGPPRRRFPWGTALVLAALALAVGLQVVHDAREAAPALPLGSEAPDFTVQKFGGGDLTLSSFRGQVVMLDFWATWCGPCREEMPLLLKVAKELEGKGVRFVAASRDEGPQAPARVGIYVAQVLPELGRFAAFADERLAALYRVDTLPTLYVIDARGRVSSVARGTLSERAIRKRVEKALESR